MTSKKILPIGSIALITASVVGLTITDAHAATYTAAEVAQHNSASDCWLTINGKVYDLTSYAPTHPGGAAAITSSCGEDVTASFPHSANALNALAPYLLGDLVTAPVLTSVTVTPETGSLTTGGTLSLTAAPKDQNGNAFSGATVTWTSNNTAVATVSSTGVVTAVAPGTATITASAANGSVVATDTASITVTAPAPAAVLTSIGISPTSTSVAIGGTKTLVATPKDQNGNAFSGATVAWTSSNTAVATVSAAGLVQGVSAGTATITATAVSGTVTVSGTSAITVTATPAPAPKPARIITNLEAKKTITAGKAKRVFAFLKGEDGKIVKDAAIVWTSSDPSVATVTGNGVLKGVKAGTATITVKATSGSTTITKDHIITVKEKKIKKPWWKIDRDDDDRYEHKKNEKRERDDD